ncbi:helicase conserved C-terminal domain protein [Mycobacterium xenopi 3993]|nr:helicase conserved C-terminal domain protein [Mycobacterium xenopi 3993]
MSGIRSHRRQPRLDADNISLYRHHRCLQALTARHPASPPRLQRGVAHPPVPRHTDGAHEQDQPREQADNHIGKLNDEQDRRGRHPERRSTLVFSQFTGFLGILRSHLDAAGIGYSYMDGSVSARGRAAALAAFGEGANQVFLISLKAGGFGLNLTEADYCFLCDPWWSPAAEPKPSTGPPHRADPSGHRLPTRILRHDRGESGGPAAAQA